MNPFERLKTIPSENPELTPENWEQHQPCWRIAFGGRRILISQPLSSFLVHLLGVLTLLVAFRFLVLHESQQSRLWWACSLFLWGLGAILAGLSYQTFGYQLKCQGRDKCCWTSWFEVVYLVLQQLSMNAMLVAVAYSCLSGLGLKLAVGFAILVSILYTISVSFGAFIPKKSLITFERMMLWSLPGFLLMIAINGYRFWFDASAMDLILLKTWAGLLLSLWAYWVYLKMGLTQMLWKRRLWFSENDVLHVTLIYWVLYINSSVLPLIRDLPV